LHIRYMSLNLNDFGI